MTSREFDLIVLGSGPSGGTVAKKASEAGKNVALIESRQFGGVCALRGCNPKKVYANAGELLDRFRRSSGKLVSDVDVSVDWQQLHAFKNEFTEPVRRGSEDSFQKAGITTLHGDAHFVSPDRIDDVAACSNDRPVRIKLGDAILTADRICIATGARPTPLPFEGAELVTHSDEFFDLKTLPRRITFIGGGYVSMELAHVVARCGAQTTIIERSDRVLSEFDPALVEQLTNHSRDRGMDVRLSNEVMAIRLDKYYIVELADGTSIECDLVVHGAGRIPNLKGLDLDAAGIEFGDAGIRVNRFMQSESNKAVFATGDCADSGMPRLTPVANEEARIVAKNVFAEAPEHLPDYGVVPKVAFTTPSIAAVGLAEAQARDTGRAIDVRCDDTSTWGSVRKTGQTIAGYKLIVDKEDDTILGAHLVGPAAEETINLFAMAIKHGLTATDVKSTLFAFPTFASDVRRMV